MLEFAAFLVPLGVLRIYYLQLDTMQKAMEVDQRAWVGISGSGSSNFKLEAAEGSPLRLSMNAQNVGKTPALKLVTVNKMQAVGPGGHYPYFGQYSRADASPLDPAELPANNLYHSHRV